MQLPMSIEERKSLIAVCKSAWFLVVTAGKFITTTSTYEVEATKAADLVGKQLDKFFKEIN